MEKDLESNAQMKFFCKTNDSCIEHKKKETNKTLERIFSFIY